MRFEQLLHETLDEMAGEMPGPAGGLARRSIVKGRRIRRTRRLAVGAVAVVAIAAVAVPWVLLPRPDRAAPPPVPATSATPGRPPATTPATALPEGWVVTRNGGQVLDRATSQFVTMSGPVLAAPAGNRIALVSNEPGPLRITDVRGTNPVTVDVSAFVGDYTWSPDGDRLAGGLTQKEPFKIGFGVIDARTGEIRRHWIDHERYNCSQCTFSWTRDGREVVLPIADRSGGEAEERVAGLQLFDAGTGRPTRALPVTAWPADPFSWSPDGRFVLAGPMFGAPVNWRLFDVTTGQSRPFPFPAVWVSNDMLLAPNDGRVLALTPDGTVTNTIDVGTTAQGEVSLGPPT
jgi:WD40 repeat protein